MIRVQLSFFVLFLFVAQTVLESLRALQETQQLILLLLGHEVDRGIAWANPLSRPELAFGPGVQQHAMRHRRATGNISENR